MKMTCVSRAWIPAGCLLMTGLAVLAACETTDRPEDEETADEPTTTSGNGGGGMGGAGDAGGSSSSSMGTCNAAPWTEDTSCQTCLESSCCFALNACEAGSECIALKTCLDDCAGNIPCAASCASMHEDGVNAVDALGACNSDSCESCAAVPPTSYDACTSILAEYPTAPYNDCVEANCCDELVTCANDSTCDLAGTLYGDAGQSTLLTCITDHCADEP